jgi:hypothetical protein
MSFPFFPPHFYFSCVQDSAKMGQYFLGSPHGTVMQDLNISVKTVHFFFFFII